MPELTLNAAKEVVSQAIKHEAFHWDDPDNVTDDDVMATAENLVEVCQQESRNGSVADAVMEVLFAAQVEPLSEPSREAYTQRFAGRASGNGGAPVGSDVPAPSAAPAVASSQGGSDPSAPAADDISSIFPGYDDLKVADIAKVILISCADGSMSPEEWEQIKSYEANHEERKTILSLEPEFKAPEPEPAPAATTQWGTGNFTLSGGAGVNVGPFPGTATASQISGHGDDVVAFYAGQSPSRAQQEGLPIPPKVDFGQTPPVLPINITETADKELSSIAAAFHSCFARAQILQSQEEGRERAAEHLEHEAERDAYVQAYEAHKSAIPEEKRSQPTSLDAARKAAEKDAEMAPKVREYRSKKVRHGIEWREQRALASGYDKAVWRIDKELDRRARLATNSRAT